MSFSQRRQRERESGRADDSYAPSYRQARPLEDTPWMPSYRRRHRRYDDDEDDDDDDDCDDWSEGTGSSTAMGWGKPSGGVELSESSVHALAEVMARVSAKHDPAVLSRVLQDGLANSGGGGRILKQIQGELTQLKADVTTKLDTSNDALLAQMREDAGNNISQLKEAVEAKVTEHHGELFGRFQGELAQVRQEAREAMVQIRRDTENLLDEKLSGLRVFIANVCQVMIENAMEDAVGGKRIDAALAGPSRSSIPLSTAKAPSLVSKTTTPPTLASGKAKRLRVPSTQSREEAVNGDAIHRHSATKRIARTPRRRR